MVLQRSCVPSAPLCKHLSRCIFLPLVGALAACAGNDALPLSGDGDTTEVPTAPTTTHPGTGVSSAVETASGVTSALSTQVAPAPSLDAAGLGRVAIKHNKSQVISRLTNAQFVNAASMLLGIDGNPFASLLPDIAPNAGYSNSGHAQSQPYDVVLAFDTVAKGMSDAVTDWSALSARYGGCTELACIDSFIAAFGERAFRRPLTTSEIQSFAPIVEAAEREQLSYQETISLLTRAFLQAPEFLYLFEDVPLTDYQLAARLAFFLTDAPPDDGLHAQAKAGTLNTVLEQETTRLLRSHGPSFARAFIYDYFDLRKAYQRTVDVDDSTVTALIDSLQRTFGDLIANDASLSALLTTKSYSAGPEVAGFLGLTLANEAVLAPETAGFLGLVTHPASLIAISNAYEGSMVSRGLFLAHQLLCIPPTPPPARAFDPSDVAVELPPDPTQRDEAEARLKDSNCLGCHMQFEPYAFALNHWAGDGRYNPDERLLDSGPVTTTLGELKFSSYKDFFPLLGKSDQFQTCMTDHLIQYAVRHTNYDPVVTDKVLASAKQGAVTDPTFQAIIRLIVQHPIFGNR